jgi:SAM-dependent methyltransferase
MPNGGLVSQVDSGKRFSKHAEYYDKYRPRYPESLLGYFDSELGFSPKSIVADIGSGTGILSAVFLKNGNMVFGVEPNEDMRRIAEANLGSYPNFRSVDGSAESTNLRESSVDFITAGQSFHWFDRPRARKEFRRILRNEGWVVLVWNTRKTSTRFLHDYDQLVRTGPMEGMKTWNDDLTDEAVGSFLGEHRTIKLPNSQELDYKGLVGRLLSSSYAPLPGEEAYDGTLARLGEIFKQHQVNGVVRFEYDCEVYAGQLSERAERNGLHA